MDTSGELSLYEGIRHLHGIAYPSFTLYKSRAKTWKQATGAQRHLSKLIQQYEDCLFLDYEHVELGVVRIKDGDADE